MMLVTPYSANFICKESNISPETVPDEGLVSEVGAGGVTLMMLDIGIWHPFELFVDVRRYILPRKPHNTRPNHARVREIIEHCEVMGKLENILQRAGDCGIEVQIEGRSNYDSRPE